MNTPYASAKSERPANSEMVEGYMDGFDLSAPEPSANRSNSYRHGFMVGRGNKLGEPPGSYAALNAAADKAMRDDDSLSVVDRTDEEPGSEIA